MSTLTDSENELIKQFIQCTISDGPGVKAVLRKLYLVDLKDHQI